MTFRFGIYRSDPLLPWRRLGHLDAGGRLYLAVLPDGCFVRFLGPADGCEFRALVGRLAARPARHGGGPVPGEEVLPYEVGTYEAGRWELRLRARLGLDGRAGERRWTVRVAGPDVLVGPDAVYRLTEEVAADPLLAAPARRPASGRR